LRAITDFAVAHRFALLAAADGMIWLCAVAFAAAMRFDFDASAVWWFGAFEVGLLSGALHVAVGGVLRLYAGRHRVGSLDEALLLGLLVLFVGAVLTTMLQLPGVPRFVPLSVPIGATALAVGGILGLRLSLRRFREVLVRPSGGLRAVIVGAGDAGTWLVRDLLTNPESPYLPVGFVDDDPGLRHYRVGYVQVLGGVDTLGMLIRAERIERVLVAAPTADASLFRRVSDQVAGTDARVKVLPPLAELVGEAPGLRDLRDLDMADLLGRHQVHTDLSSVAAYLAGRRVLVTGAGGSIGSELCRQIHRLGPARLGMLDRDESALHALQLSIDGRGLLSTRDLILCDIRDRAALHEVFAEFEPQVVFHAAALKHLPMLEMYPQEGCKTNVVGTANVLAAAGAAGAQVFVNISTDKAADPTSVLGATKRAAEHLTAQAAQDYAGRYVSVRFGNVLGSRGSVLTAFAEQIRTGGPVTVTDPGVTRYFMTVAEAVQLVLQAGALGGSGEVMVLEMGEPVPIESVARRLIAMSGKPISIVHTGLRPGEKLHEVLSSACEQLCPTAHPLISHVPVEPRDLASVLAGLPGPVAELAGPPPAPGQAALEGVAERSFAE
jgi:FlaA1/EpsC-like NDP-sugar epimerase